MLIRNARNMRVGIIFSLALAFVVIIATALYADVPHMISALAHFRWELFPLVLGLTLFNYALRFLKWQYYLKLLKIDLSWGKSFLIFLSGLSMAITPGKIGELLKSYLLKRATGAPISRTAPIIVAERLTDGLAMLILAATGLMLTSFGWELLLALLLLGFIGIFLIQNRRLAFAILKFGDRLPLVSRITHLIREFYESSYTLLQWRPLLLATCIGLVSWSGEGIALYYVFQGLGVAGSFDLLIKAMFILSASSLIGSASGLPGGLGTADGSMLGLIRLLVSPSSTLGGAATLLIRLCTLWFGLLIGVIALPIFRSIQRVDVSQALEESEKNAKAGKDTPSSKDEHLASTSANTGE